MLTPPQLDALLQALLAAKQELLHEGHIDLTLDPDDPTDRADEDTQPYNEMNQVIASKRNRERSKKLQKIHHAISRLEHSPEDFGQCLECDEPIAWPRLQWMPWTLHCVGCEEKKNPRTRSRRRHATDYSHE